MGFSEQYDWYRFEAPRITLLWSTTLVVIATSNGSGMLPDSIAVILWLMAQAPMLGVMLVRFNDRRVQRCDLFDDVLHVLILLLAALMVLTGVLAT